MKRQAEKPWSFKLRGGTQFVSNYVAIIASIFEFLMIFVISYGIEPIIRELYLQGTSTLVPLSFASILGTMLNIWRIVGIRKKWKDRAVFIGLVVIAFIAFLQFLQGMGLFRLW